MGHQNLVYGPPKSSLWATLTLLLGFGPLFPYFMGHTLDGWDTFFSEVSFWATYTSLWATFGPLDYFLGHFRTIYWATLGHFGNSFWATLVARVLGPHLGHLPSLWATFALFLGHFWATFLFLGPLYLALCQKVSQGFTRAQL